MVREYAVDPEDVASLAQAVSFLDQFGRGSGRMLSAHRAPNKWLGDLLRAARARHEREEMSQRQYDRLLQLVQNLKTSTAARADRFLPSGSRNRTYDGTLGWLDATLKEHGRLAFHAVIAADARADFPAMEADSLQPKFQVTTAVDVPQTEAAFCETLGPLLAVSRRLLLIDPYYRLGERRYHVLLSHLLTQHPHLEEVSLAFAAGKGEVTELQLRSWHDRLRRTGDLQVNVWPLQERPGGLKLHNRYLLTEVAGVIVDPSLSTGSAGHNFSLNLMPEDQYQAVVEQYWERQAFDVTGESSLHFS